MAHGYIKYQHKSALIGKDTAAAEEWRMPAPHRSRMNLQVMFSDSSDYLGGMHGAATFAPFGKHSLCPNNNPHTQHVTCTQQNMF